MRVCRRSANRYLRFSIDVRLAAGLRKKRNGDTAYSNCIAPRRHYWMVQAQQPIYTVSEWPQGISELPYVAFRQNAPDSWTLIATVKAGGVTMSNVTFTHT
jgi:hypothetical protein